VYGIECGVVVDFVRDFIDSLFEGDNIGNMRVVIHFEFKIN